MLSTYLTSPLDNRTVHKRQTTRYRPKVILLLVPDEDPSHGSVGVAGFKMAATATAILCTLAADREGLELPLLVVEVAPPPEGGSAVSSFEVDSSAAIYRISA